MAEKIYIRNADGELEPLEEKEFETEDLLQKLIGEYPELLGGDQMCPSDPRRWILVNQEILIEGLEEVLGRCTSAGCSVLHHVMPPSPTQGNCNGATGY